MSNNGPDTTNNPVPGPAGGPPPPPPPPPAPMKKKEASELPADLRVQFEDMGTFMASAIQQQADELRLLIDQLRNASDAAERSALAPRLAELMGAIADVRSGFGDADELRVEFDSELLAQKANDALAMFAQHELGMIGDQPNTKAYVELDKEIQHLLDLGVFALDNNGNLTVASTDLTKSQLEATKTFSYRFVRVMKSLVTELNERTAEERSGKTAQIRANERALAAIESSRTNDLFSGIPVLGQGNDAIEAQKIAENATLQAEIDALEGKFADPQNDARALSRGLDETQALLRLMDDAHKANLKAFDAEVKSIQGGNDIKSSAELSEDASRFLTMLFEQPVIQQQCAEWFKLENPKQAADRMKMFLNGDINDKTKGGNPLYDPKGFSPEIMAQVLSGYLVRDENVPMNMFVMFDDETFLRVDGLETQYHSLLGMLQDKLPNLNWAGNNDDLNFSAFAKSTRSSTASSSSQAGPAMPGASNGTTPAFARAKGKAPALPQPEAKADDKPEWQKLVLKAKKARIALEASAGNEGSTSTLAAEVDSDFDEINGHREIWFDAESQLDRLAALDARADARLQYFADGVNPSARGAAKLDQAEVAKLVTEFTVKATELSSYGITAEALAERRRIIDELTTEKEQLLADLEANPNVEPGMKSAFRTLIDASLSTLAGASEDNARLQVQLNLHEWKIEITDPATVVEGLCKYMWLHGFDSLTTQQLQNMRKEAGVAKSQYGNTLVLMQGALGEAMEIVAAEKARSGPSVRV